MMYATYFFMILGLLAPSKGGAASCDPVLTTLFAPPSTASSHYEVCTTAQPLDAVVANRRSADGTGGARFTFSEPEALNPLDAFGGSGVYNRSKLARLFSGGRATVVRGWRQEADRFVSVTLISPFPDAALTRLTRGTMEIRFTYNFVIRP
jgi:hypothetical protein